MPMLPQSRTQRRTDSSSRFSPWFHGHSVMRSERPRAFTIRAPKTWRMQDRVAPDACASPARWIGRRSPSSTRSIIDPTSSPNVGAAPSPPEPHSQPGTPIAGTRYESEEVIGVRGRTRTRPRLALSRPRKKPQHRNSEGRKWCFPGIQTAPVRRKVVGTLSSAVILCLLFTI